VISYCREGHSLLQNQVPTEVHSGTSYHRLYKRF